MEQKTIGSFIAILRKANGMTQKELAEKLNVSDKAVSRWERNESAPDLMLIPIIAEIFGITADELLRGKRTSHRQTEETLSGKSDKQLSYLLSSNETKLKIRSIISGGIAIIGLIAAIICNSALLRASLGFFVGCIFYITAAVCEACFAVTAFSTVNSPDFDSERIIDHKKRIIKIISMPFAVIIIMFTATLPLLLGDVYVGINGDDWLIYALICLAILTVISAFGSWIIRLHLIKKNILKANEREIQKNKLKIKTAVILTAVLAVTAVANFAIYTSIPQSAFAKGTVHYTVDNFKSFIETPVQYDSYNYHVYQEIQTQTITESLPEHDDNYYTDYEQEWQEILKQNENIVYDFKAKELFRYSHLNENIVEIHFGDSENRLPITTYTYQQLREGQNMKNLFISVPFILLYLIEIASAFLIYRKKNKQV